MQPSSPARKISIKRALKITTFFLIIFNFISTTSFAQYNAVDWGVYFSDTTTGFAFTDDELIDDIKIDNNSPENIYVVGRTRSVTGTIFPCAGNSVTFGKGDVAIAKYDRCGNLQWSRYLGNKKKTDYGYSIALDYDSLGNTLVYVAGEMKTNGKAPTAIVCDGGAIPFRVKPAGSWDGFIGKYDQDGNLQRWTYFGGNDSISEKVDQILGIAISDRKIFVTGYTESPDLHKGAVKYTDTTFDGAGDGFLAAFSSDLHSLEYFTYIGGGGKDRSHGIRIYEPAGGPIDIFVDGTTPSTNGIFAGAGFDNSLSGDLDGFVGKWEDDDQDGVFTKTWCTYLGGSGTERARDMDIDDQGNIMLVGQTNSTDLAWANGYDPTYNGGTDGFIIKIPNAGGSPVWGSYFGGYGDEEAVALTWKKGIVQNDVIIGGITYSSQKTTCLPDPNPNNYTPFILANPIMSLINGKKGAAYCPGTVGDAFIAMFTDVPSGQTLVQSTFIGGSGNEINGENQLSYNPSFAITNAGELYIAFNSKSTDIKKAVGNSFQKLYGTYSGGIDAFIARLIDSSSADQFNCANVVMKEDDENSYTIINESAVVYPNPSNQLFNLQIESEEAVSIIVNVFDNTGRLILSKPATLQGGTSTTTIDLADQAEGLFLLQYFYEGKSYRATLLKQ